jgi:RHS repeat-associated protein
MPQSRCRGARIVLIQKPDGTSIQVDYLDSSNGTRVEDENGNKTTTLKNANDAIVEVRLPNYTKATYTYNGMGQMISAEDMRSIKTQYRYDALGRSTQIEQANGNSQSFEYNILGHLLRSTDANGHNTLYTNYDALGRPGKVSYADGVSVTYQYDSGYKGQLSSYDMTGPQANSAQYDYDAFGNVIGENKTQAGIAWQIRRQYNDTGDMLEETDSITQLSKQYDYDRWGQLQKLDLIKDGKKERLLNATGYSKTHQLTGYTLPQYDSSRVYTYDPKNDRVLSIEDSIGKQLILKDAYTYDPAGNRSSRKTTKPNTSLSATVFRGVFAGPKDKTYAINTSYTYDPLDRLTSYTQSYSDGPTFGKKYEYDNTGNMTRTHYTGDHPNTVKMSYQHNSDQLDKRWDTFQLGDAGWFEYTYDKNGNRTQLLGKDNKEIYLAHDYTWDARNRLTAFTAKGLDGFATESNKYNANGLRYEQYTFGPNQAETTLHYYYADDGRLLAQQDGTNLYSYINLGSHPIVRYYTNMSPTQTENPVILGPDPGIQPNTQIPAEPGITPAPAIIYHTDPLGTTIATSHTSNNKTYISVFQSQPYGNTESWVHTSTGKDPYEYTGKFTNQHSYLSYFHARHYDPFAARFISHDPVSPVIANPKTMNRYQFVYQNPLKNVDPDGEKAYLANRDLDISFGIGKHQFKILIPDNPIDFPSELLSKLGVPPMQDLDNGRMGWVIGGHNKDGALQARYFQKADFQATKEYFNSKLKSWYKADFSTELSETSHKGLSDSEYITSILKNTQNYISQSARHPIPYPSVLIQAFTYNSNAWAQSLTIYSGGSSHYFNNGFNPGQLMRLDPSLFQPLE